MEIINPNTLQRITAAAETPLGGSLVWMLVVLGVGMLLVAMLGLIFSRGTARHARWEYDGTSYDDYRGGDWNLFSASSWFDSGDGGSSGSFDFSGSFDSSGGDFGSDD